MATVGEGFALFHGEVPEVAAAHMAFVEANAAGASLDEKTRHLCYLSVLAAAGLTGGLPFHVELAKRSGASREDVRSAVLVGMPAVGLSVLDALPIALTAFDTAVG